MTKKLGTHTFVCNKRDNGGESLVVCTDFLDNGDTVIINQTITLNSYCNSASFNLCGVVLSPTLLRELANQIESEENKYKNLVSPSS